MMKVVCDIAGNEVNQLKHVKPFLRLLPLMLMVSLGNDISITAFLNPHAINAGGATGLSTVVSTWVGVSFAIVYALVNLPILYLGVRYLSVRYSLYSVFVAAVTTVLFPYLQPFMIQLPAVLSAVLGAVIYGVSIGLTYRYDFSLGGFALLAKVIEVMTRKNIGSIFAVINFVPVILNACTVGLSLSLLWSIIFITITGEIINWTVMGRDYLMYCKTRVRRITHPRIRHAHKALRQV